MGVFAVVPAVVAVDMNAAGDTMLQGGQQFVLQVSNHLHTRTYTRVPTHTYLHTRTYTHVPTHTYMYVCADA